jgi:hypothetical protein
VNVMAQFHPENSGDAYICALTPRHFAPIAIGALKAVWKCLRRALELRGDYR